MLLAVIAVAIPIVIPQVLKFSEDRKIRHDEIGLQEIENSIKIALSYREAFDEIYTILDRYGSVDLYVYYPNNTIAVESIDKSVNASFSCLNAELARQFNGRGDEYRLQSKKYQVGYYLIHIEWSKDDFNLVDIHSKIVH